MTSVSLINPYAPQPTADLGLASPYAAAKSMQPIAKSSGSGGPGGSTDQSGSGAGNGSANGGSDRAMAKTRHGPVGPLFHATPQSVVDAQSRSEASEARQSDLDARTEARAEARQETLRALDEEARAEKAQEIAERRAEERKAMPQFRMPDPLPTAPILKRDDD